MSKLAREVIEELERIDRLDEETIKVLYNVCEDELVEDALEVMAGMLITERKEEEGDD